MLRFLCAVCVLLCVAACNNRRELHEGDIAVADVAHDETNGVYYWKTVFSLDRGARDFLADHKIGRIYMRMFDAVEDLCGRSPDDIVYPNASIRIDDKHYRLLCDSLTDIEVVPVVYITLDALKIMAGLEHLMAENIVIRVRNMVEYNALPGVKELQLDCDWTRSTEETFFTLCREAKNVAADLGLPWELSSTIRLHQLSRPVPPVDRGVLMVYNTGSFNNPDTHNSIIDYDDVRPYLRHLPAYDLHLDVAYPAYSWQLLFSNRTFTGLTNSLDLNDTTAFHRKNDNVFIAKRDIPHKKRLIKKGDMVRAETSSYADIFKVKRRIEQIMAGRPHSNIIYHLDSDNLSKYSHNEIESILSCSR